MSKQSMQDFKKCDLVHIVKAWSEAQHSWVNCDPKPGIVITAGGEFITVLVDGEKQFLLPEELRGTRADQNES